MEVHDARTIEGSSRSDGSARRRRSRRWCSDRYALTQGIVWIQYRVENVHIVPVFGTGALNVSPPLHGSGIYTYTSTTCLGCGQTRPGQHKVRVDLVNANHQVFPGCAMCSQTVTFMVPETASADHPH
jgi:hypothetical protein